MKSSLKSYLPFLIPAAFVLVAHRHFLFEIPCGIHAWAQWDRYAIALGFLENGFRLFYPQTFVYNHQFPSDWMQASPSTITAVDFPLHEWVVASIMKLTGNHSMTIFKVYTTALVLTGLFFWWKTALLLTGNIFKSLIALVIAAASPVFLFYAGSTLPGLPSLASAFAGMYFYSLFKKHQRIVDFNIAVSLFTLAALTRTTFVIPLMGVFLTEVAGNLKKQSRFKSLITATILSVAALAANFFYNRFLAASYGSMFLNELMPANSGEQALDCIQVMFENWKFEWLTGWHYALLALLIGLGFFKKTKEDKTSGYLLFYDLKKWTIFSLAGCTLFLIAMLRQFPHHDYYFIDTFLLPLSMVFLLLLHALNLDYAKPFVTTLITFLAVIMMIKSYKVINHRNNAIKNERFCRMIQNFSGADKWLEKSGIDENTGILVMDVPAPNPPFILMKRKGYVVLSSNLHRPAHLNAAFEFPFDFLVMEEERKHEIEKHSLVYLQCFDTVSTNGKLILMKRKRN